MAFPTAVNDQITDAVSQANSQVLDNASALSVGTLYVTTAHALATMFHSGNRFTFVSRGFVSTEQAMALEPRFESVSGPAPGSKARLCVR